MSDVILVVDDTPSKRYVVASWLRRGGYTVIEAATGAQALERFGEGGIDLVLLDVRLPDITGFEVCEQIKAHPVHGTTPVIHFSAAAIHAVDRTHGLERGADAYLVEPIDPDEMLATVTSILRYYQARLQAERLAGRLTELVRATASMGSATTQRRLLEAAAGGGAKVFGSPIVLITDDADGARIVASCTGPGDPVVVRPSMVDLGNEPLGVRTRDEPSELWPQAGFAPGMVRVLTVRPRPERSAIYAVVPVPAIAEGPPVLTLFGQAVTAATDALRLFEEEHNLALTLQRSLLPGRLPAIDGLDIAVRYVPASRTAEIGGDFYEVIRLADQVIVAVGDVGGHSLHAATVMAELRHATRAYVAEGHSPAAVVDRLNSLMADLIPGEIATLCLLTVEPSSGRVRMANAGHPPPAVSGPQGVRTVSDHGALLGIRVSPAFETELVLETGETLIVYTDGLIERRDECIDESVARLTAAATTVEPDLEQFASRLLEEVGPSDPGDDVALVVLRRRPAESAASRRSGDLMRRGGEDPRVTIGATPAEVFDQGSPPLGGGPPPPAAHSYAVDLPALSRLRAEVARYGREAGLAEEIGNDLLLAANELLTNVVRHGGGAGRMWLWHDDSWFYCLVADHGPGLPTAPKELFETQPTATAPTGRGLWLIWQFADRVRIQTGPGGTAVTIAFPLANK